MDTRGLSSFHDGVRSPKQTQQRTPLTPPPLPATTIYYNCCFQNCTTLEWINTSGGSGTFSDLLDNARSVNTRYLLGLHHDPYLPLPRLPLSQLSH